MSNFEEWKSISDEGCEILCHCSCHAGDCRCLFSPNCPRSLPGDSTVTKWYKVDFENLRLIPVEIQEANGDFNYREIQDKPLEV